MVQIVAETALGDLLVEIPPRRAEHPHLDPQPPVAADTAHLGAFEGAEQLGLQGEIQIADLVDQERPAVGLLEHALSLPGRARERAALVAEQLGFDQARGHGGAVEDDERPRRARSPLVKRLGEHLLARAGLAFDDHRKVGAGETLAQWIEAAHLAAAADEASEAHGHGHGTRLLLIVAPDANLARPDAESLASADVGVRDAHAVHEGAVGRAEVGHTQLGAGGFESGVAARDLSIRQPEVAHGAGPEQDARGLRPIDRDGLVPVRPRLHHEGEDGCRLRIRSRRLQEGRHLVAIAMRTVRHASFNPAPRSGAGRRKPGMGAVCHPALPDARAELWVQRRVTVLGGAPAPTTSWLPTAAGDRPDAAQPRPARSRMQSPLRSAPTTRKSSCGWTRGATGELRSDSRRAALP